MKSVFGVRSTFLCAHPHCPAESVSIAIARSEEPDQCKVDVPLPFGWQLAEYKTYCPDHSPAEPHLMRLMRSVQIYRNCAALDEAQAMVNR